ncbi:hypothetical protein [Pilimelia terevasa]|nr:hypothetical protein [Pilimelia terevasa]
MTDAHGEFGVADLFGLTLAEAERLAEARGYEVRVVGADGVGFPVTMDFRPDRLDVYLIGGRVVDPSGEDAGNSPWPPPRHPEDDRHRADGPR